MQQIMYHIEAATRLGLIKDEFRSYIQKSMRTSEKDGIEFIKKAYKKHGLINDSKKEFAIVAFGQNTSEVHYFPKGEGLKLKPNTLILLDIWARLGKKNTPYADMTWMFWYGKKVPDGIEKEWLVLRRARDTAISKIKKCLLREVLPSGVEIDRAAHDVLGHAGFGEYIKHTIGHSLGSDHPHGKLPGINWREYRRLSKNVGYTIEPGTYFKDHGLRTEIDFYISKDNKVIVTTPIQKRLEII